MNVISKQMYQIGDYFKIGFSQYKVIGICPPQEIYTSLKYIVTNGIKGADGYNERFFFDPAISELVAC